MLQNEFCNNISVEKVITSDNYKKETVIELVDDGVPFPFPEVTHAASKIVSEHFISSNKSALKHLEESALV